MQLARYKVSYTNTQAYFSRLSLRAAREPAFPGGHWKSFQEALSSEGGELGAMPGKESSQMATLTKRVLQRFSQPPPPFLMLGKLAPFVTACFPLPNLPAMPASPPCAGLLSWTHTCSVLPVTLSLCL